MQTIDADNLDTAFLYSRSAGCESFLNNVLWILRFGISNDSLPGQRMFEADMVSCPSQSHRIAAANAVTTFRESNFGLRFEPRNFISARRPGNDDIMNVTFLMVR
jgi:hypothetical protein